MLNNIRDQAWIQLSFVGAESYSEPALQEIFTRSDGGGIAKVKIHLSTLYPPWHRRRRVLLYYNMQVSLTSPLALPALTVTKNIICR